MPTFRLISVLWAFALLAAALAAFGAWGVLFALVVVAFWMLRFTFLQWCVALLIIGVLVSLLLPPVSLAREAARRTQCKNNLRVLGITFELYAGRHGALPAAAGSTDRQGPAQSWRLRLLPTLEHQALFDAYRHDEAWDSPNNRIVGQSPIDIFSCPNDPPVNLNQSHTNYFAVVGPRAAFLPDRGRTWEEFKDDRSQTILLIETAGRATPWLKPEDLSFDEALSLLTTPPGDATVHFAYGEHPFFFKPNQGSMMGVVFADGRARHLSLPISMELATALLTIDGGEAIDLDELRRSIQPQLDYGNIYALAMFVLLSLAPAAARLRRKAPAAT